MGLVPEIEEREAALFNGYSWRSWAELSYGEKRDGVAHFRLHRLIEMHKQDAAIEHSKAEARRQQHRR